VGKMMLGKTAGDCVSPEGNGKTVYKIKKISYNLS
jgi:transcription elongation GreA/GreB family factor